MQERSATTRSTRHHDFQSPRCGCRLRLFDDTAARCPMAANYVVPAEMSRWRSRRPPIRSSATVKTNDLSSCRRVKTALKRPAAHTETQARLPRAVSPWPGHGVTGSLRVHHYARQRFLRDGNSAASPKAAAHALRLAAARARHAQCYLGIPLSLLVPQRTTAQSVDQSAWCIAAAQSSAGGTASGLVLLLTAVTCE